MPTRNTIIAATPRCPGHQHPIHGWQECGRPLTWNHSHEAWTCRRHGMVLSAETAASQVSHVKA